MLWLQFNWKIHRWICQQYPARFAKQDPTVQLQPPPASLTVSWGGRELTRRHGIRTRSATALALRWGWPLDNRADVSGVGIRSCASGPTEWGCLASSVQKALFRRQTVVTHDMATDWFGFPKASQKALTWWTKKASKWYWYICFPPDLSQKNHPGRQRFLFFQKIPW